jgi:hypothetical protein
MTRSSLRTFRWVIIGFGLVAGALLLADGELLLGAVIGGLALLRLVLMLMVQRRRRQFRSAATTGPGSGAPPILRTLARGQFEVAAGAIGVAPSDLRVEFARGRSIAEVAGAHGVPVETVVAAVVADATAKIDRSVADGKTPPRAAARIKPRLPAWATRMVHGHRGELRVGAGARR